MKKTFTIFLLSTSIFLTAVYGLFSIRLFLIGFEVIGVRRFDIFVTLWPLAMESIAFYTAYYILLFMFPLINFFVCRKRYLLLNFALLILISVHLTIFIYTFSELSNL